MEQCGEVIVRGVCDLKSLGVDVFRTLPRLEQHPLQASPRPRYERAKKERPEDAFERAQVSVETFNEALGVFLSRQDAEITPYVSQARGWRQGEAQSSVNCRAGGSETGLV